MIPRSDAGHVEVGERGGPVTGRRRSGPPIVRIDGPRRVVIAVTSILSAVLGASVPSFADQTGKARPTMGAPVSGDALRGVAPALADDTDRILGELWRRTDLSPRDRSIATVAALVADGKADSLAPYIDRALDDGVTPAEIGEVITHLAFYAGWPDAVSAAAVAKDVFARRGIGADRLVDPGRVPPPADTEADKRRADYVERSFGAVAPALRDYTNGVLFGDLWRRSGLAPRDRSLVTVSALVAGGKAQQLVGHLNLALDNGLTRAEIGAVISHLAFYAGWPNAVSAAAVAKSVFEKRP